MINTLKLIFDHFLFATLELLLRDSPSAAPDGNAKMVPENGKRAPADKERQSLREQDQLPAGYMDAFG